MLRNVASQKWRVYAWDATTGLPKTGDAANITARITIDDGTPAATNDANPTEVDATNEIGYYDFDNTQAETNGAKLSLSPQSTTSNIVVIACPPVIYTVPQYDSVLGIASDGDLQEVNTLTGHTVQTADHTTAIADLPTVAEFNVRTLAANDYATSAACTEVRLAELDAANLPSDIDAVLARSSVRSSTAQAGAAGSITLDAGASAIDNFYDNLWVFITSGTGAGQVRLVKDAGYTGSSKIALVDRNWVTNPDATSGFTLLPISDIPISNSQADQIAARVELAIVNEGDATAVMQAIADQIAADWVAGDASPIAVAAAVRTNLATELGRIDVNTSTRLAPTTAGRTLKVAVGGETAVDLGNVIGVLGNANVGWIDGNNRVDVGSWLGTVATVSPTTALPEVDAKSISDNAAAANNVQANIGNLDAAITTRATPSQVNAEVLDVVNVDTPVAGVTMVEALRRLGARNNKLSGAGSGTETVTDWADSANTIVFTVDGSGNISAVVYN